jgi:hypothetical protein
MKGVMTNSLLHGSLSGSKNMFHSFIHSVAVFNEGGSRERGFAAGTLLVEEVPSYIGNLQC